MNKGNSGCFINLSPIFTIFSIPDNSDIHSSHVTSCWLQWKPFDWNLCVYDTSLGKLGNSAFSQGLGYCDMLYINIIMDI